MEVQFEVPMKIFQSSRGTFQDDSGKTVSYSNVMAQVGDDVLKVNCDDDLTSYQGKDVTAVCAIKAGAKQVAKLVIVRVEER